MRRRPLRSTLFPYTTLFRSYFAGGEVRVDMAAARAALERLAGRVRLSPTDVAWGIHDVVNENMASAARVHIAERGRDPRSEEHTSELQSRLHLVCRLLLENK